MKSNHRTETDYFEDIALEESLGYHLIVWNDHVNTFDWVIATLMEVCGHEPEQAEQCTLIIHYKGKCSVASICRKYGINDSLYYKWTKDFMEAGKKRLNGDTERNANAEEVEYLKKQNNDLKKAIADLYLHNESLKKSLTGLE